MIRAALALLLLVACHAPASQPAPAKAAAPSTVNEPSPFDALAAEAERLDLALLVARDGRILVERRSALIDAHPISVLDPVILHLAARGNAPKESTDDWVLEHTPLLLHDYSGRLIGPELCERGAYAPLGILPGEHTYGGRLSLAAAERIARLFADGGVFEGRRLLPEPFVARVTSSETKLAWDPIGEGELAVITRQIFDSWRSVPAIDRTTLTAVEPLVGEPIPVDDFDRALEERLPKRSDLFKHELAKAERKPFERRWQKTVGFGAFLPREAVVVLTRTKLITVYATPREGYGMRSLIPLLRKLE